MKPLKRPVMDNNDISKRPVYDPRERVILDRLFADAIGGNEEGCLYISKSLLQVTLPHRNPGQVPAWGKQNGNASFSMRPWWNPQTQEYVYPYGGVAKILLGYLASECFRIHKLKELNPELKIDHREISLGNNLNDFITNTLGLKSGGKTYKVFLEQMKALIFCDIHFAMKINTGSRTGTFEYAKKMADGYLLWDEDKELSLFTPEGIKTKLEMAPYPNFVRLSHDIAELFVNGNFPVSFEITKKLSDWPLAMDAYWALSFRASNLTEPLAIKWPQVMKQYGADYKNVKEFARHFKKSIEKVREHWPELNVTYFPGGLRIFPSASSVARSAPKAVPTTTANQAEPRRPMDERAWNIFRVEGTLDKDEM